MGRSLQLAIMWPGSACLCSVYAKCWSYSDIRSCCHQSPSGMILLYLAVRFLHRRCFWMNHFCKVHVIIIDSYSYLHVYRLQWLYTQLAKVDNHSAKDDRIWGRGLYSSSLFQTCELGRLVSQCVNLQAHAHANMHAISLIQIYNNSKSQIKEIVIRNIVKIMKIQLFTGVFSAFWQCSQLPILTQCSVITIT